MLYFSSMKNNVVFFVLGLLLLSSCKKGVGDFTLTGTITDQTFSTNHVGATVGLYATVAGSLETNQIASMTTDENGTYSFTFPRSKIETYYIKVEKENYFDIFEAIPFSDLTLEEDNVRNYSTNAKAWVRFHVVNSSGSPSDQMEYARQEGKIDCEDCCPGGSQFFYGVLDTTFYCINDGNATYSGYYWVSGGTQGPIWVTTPPFDTTDITISY